MRVGRRRKGRGDGTARPAIQVLSPGVCDLKAGTTGRCDAAEADLQVTRSLPSPQEEVDVAARGSAQAPSEAVLMRAVLEDALECFQGKFDIERPLAQRRARQAEEWFFNEDSSELFSFVSVCGVLGLAPECVRQRLMRWSRSRLRSCPKRFSVPGEVVNR